MELIAGHDVLLHADRLRLEAFLRDLENPAFDVVEQARDVVLLFVGAGGVLRADADDLAEGVLLLDDLEVVAGVCRRGEEGEKLRDEGRAADLIELISARATSP